MAADRDKHSGGYEMTMLMMFARAVADKTKGAGKKIAAGY